MRRRQDCGALETRRKSRVSWRRELQTLSNAARQARGELRIDHGFSPVESSGDLDLQGGDGVERWTRMNVGERKRREIIEQHWLFKGISL